MNEAVVKEVNKLVEKGLKALDDFMCLNQKQIDYIVAKCSVAGLDNHGVLAASAIEETKTMQKWVLWFQSYLQHQLL